MGNFRIRSLVLSRVNGSIGLVLIMIALAVLLTVVGFTIRYQAGKTWIERESTYQTDMQAVRSALEARKKAVLRHYYARTSITDQEQLQEYYFFFPKSLDQLVSEGYLDLDSTSLRLGNPDADGVRPLLDASNRRILYYRSQLADPTSALQTDFEGCQFAYQHESDGTLNVVVPSVAVIFPGGRAQFGTNAAGFSQSFSSLYKQRTPAGFQSDYDLYFAEDDAMFNEDEIYSAASAVADVHQYDAVLVLDASQAYREIDLHMRPNLASISDDVLTYWREAYVQQIEDRARDMRMSPDNYLLLASTRNTDSSGWPRMLQDLCLSTNEQVFGVAEPTVRIGMRPEKSFVRDPEDGSGAFIRLQRWETDENETSFQSPAAVSGLIKDLVLDTRWLSAQQLSSLNPGYLPGIVMEFSCACRTQNEQAQRCEDLSATSTDTYMDSRDLYIREMFLQSSLDVRSSECPVCDYNASTDSCNPPL